MKKKVLITGGAGYLGNVIVRKFLKEGEDVRVFDKGYFGFEFLDDIKDKIEIVEGDIRKFDPKTLNNVKSVVHLAGLSSDPTAEYDPVANNQINNLATGKLARACKKVGIKRFVFASSCSVYYSMNPVDHVLDENSKIKPEAPYSKSKYLAERTLLRLADNDFHPVILRKGTIFGYSKKMRYDLVVNAFTKDAFSKRTLTVHAGGRMWRPMLGIDDAARAYHLAATAHPGKVKGQIFNVLDNNFRVIDIAHKVKESLLKNRRVRVKLDVQEVGTSRSYRVNGDKFKQILGFKPRAGIGKAALKVWDDLKAGRDYDNPVYYTIKWMEKIKNW